MASSVQVFGNLSFTQSSLKKAASQVRSAVSKISVPISVTVTKSSISAVKKQIKSSISQVPYAISITVTKASLSAANKQIRSAFGKAGLPQITVHPATIAAINSLARSVARINSGGLGGGRGGAGGGPTGGGRGGRRGGFSGALPLGRLSGEASEFSKSMDAATARVFAFGATAIVLGSVGQAFRELVTTTIEVEKRLAEIQAIFGTSDATFAKFRETIFDVASNTGQSFDTVADGAAELARQGLSAAETAKRLNASLVLTRISGIDAKDSVGALTSVINGFSSAGLNANQIINKIVAVDTAFAVSAKDLADGFTRAGSTAEDAGVSFDDLLGLITALQQKTARGGAVIGNGLKTIFTRISRGSVIEDLKALGVQIDASQSGVQKLQAIGQAFEDAKGDPLRQAAIKEKAAGGFQINLISAALKDLNSEQSLFTKASKESSQATNEAFKLNAELNKTMAAQINDVVVSITNMSEKIGQVTFAPALKSFLEFSSTITESFNTSLNPEAGFNFTKGFFSGVGTFIQGPGAVLVLSGFYKIFSIVAGFANQGLKDIFKITLGKKAQLDIENKITGALDRNARISAIVFNTNTSVARQKQLAVALINREVAAEKNRLSVLKTISAEMAKQNAYINADGGISFDKNKGAKFAREAGNIARSPLATVAGSLAVGAGGEFVKGKDKSKDEVDSITRQIDKLNQEISGLNTETDKEKISDLTKKIKDLNLRSSELTAKSEEFQKSVNTVATNFSLALAAFQFGSQVGGIVTALALLKLGLDEFVVPKIVDYTNRPIEGADVSDIGVEIRKVQREFDKLARATSLLSQEVEIGAQTFRSEMKVRSEAQKGFDQNAIGGISSNLELNKGLVGILAGSDSKEVKRQAQLDQSELEKKSNRFELGQLIEKINDTAQKAANVRAQDAGFASTKNIPIGPLALSSKYEDSIKKFLDAASKEKIGLRENARKSLDRQREQLVFQQADLTEDPEKLKENRDKIAAIDKRILDISSSIEKNSLAAQLPALPDKLGNDAYKKWAEGTIKALEERGSVDGGVSQVGLDLAKKVLSSSNGLDVGKDLKSTISLTKSIAEGLEKASTSGSSEDYKILSDKLEELKTKGLIPEEDIKQFDTIISSFAEQQRKDVLDRAQLAIDSIRKQREVNDKFITDLKGVYEKNVTSVRDLRKGKIQFTKDEFADPFSETGADKLDKFGISGEKRSGISGVTNVGAFSSNFLGAATEDLRKTLDTLKSGGVTGVLDKTSQDILTKQLQDVSLSPQTSPDNATRAALQPFYEAEKLFKTATTSDQFNQAVDLQRQGVRGVQGLNVDPNSDKAFAIKNLIATSAQQAKIVGGVVNTLSLRNPGYVGENTSSNALGTAQTTVGNKLNADEQAAANKEKASLTSLDEFLKNINKVFETERSGRTSTLGQEVPEAIKTVAESALKLKEFTDSISSKTASEASTQTFEKLKAMGAQAELTAASLKSVEEKTTSFGSALAIILAKIEGVNAPNGRDIAGRPIGQTPIGQAD